MKKISFMGSLVLGAFSLLVYIFVEIAEQSIMNFLFAYMTASQVSFSSDLFTLDFSNLKIMALVMAVVFFALAIIALVNRDKY